MIKILKRLLLILPVAVVLMTSQNAYAQTAANNNTKSVNLDYGWELTPLITNPNAYAVIETCRKYTGFINKIVMCVTNFVSRTDIYYKINSINTKFAGAANAALIFYIMFFGLRLSMNVIDNIKAEIMIVLMACFFVTYANNAFRLQSFMRFFVGFQNEFANAAFAALGEDTLGQDPEENCVTSNALPKEKVGSIDRPSLSLWERMDCILAGFLGAQPVFEFTTQYSDAQGNGTPSDLTSIGTTNGNRKYLFYDLTANNTSFNDLTKDPFCFLRYTFEFDIGSINTTLQSAAQNASNVATDECLKRLGDNFTATTADELLKIPRPVKTDRYETYIIFSFLIMILGMLSQEPAIGMIILFTGFFVVILMLAAFAQVVLVYLSSLFAIMVLGIFAPLILPCVLFKATQNIFNKWLQLLFAYSLQPGILICYLAFMLFVLQFVMEYKVIGIKDDGTPQGVPCVNTDPVNPPVNKPYRFDPDCKGAVPSFKEYVNLLFRNGEVYEKELTKIAKKNTSSFNDNNFQMNLLQSGSTIREASELDEMSWSFMGRGNDVYAVSSTESSNELRQGLIESGFKINNTGTSVSQITVPTFSFAKMANTVMNQFINTDPTNSNLQGSANNMQQGSNIEQNSGMIVPFSAGVTLTTVEVIAKQAAKNQKMNYTFTIGFMQILMIMFVALSITFSFMGTVMDLGGKLAGVNAPKIGGINVYNVAASKLSSFAKS